MTVKANAAEGSLAGQLLIAMPGMPDPRFEKTVVYMCAHSNDGAMGLVINRALEAITFPALLEQLGIEPATPEVERIRVLSGGPVETGRGFVLHSRDYRRESTVMVGRGVALTATIDILRSIADGSGPRRHVMALGYAGWGPGQLDSEIRANGWLNVEADDDLVFDADIASKWDRAMAKIGIDPRMLSDTAGNA
ncbi:MAG: YqgE/AlgH family protein [Rhodospirillales bacterium]|nr:MAG: YqgE/AlgH family protein [Rhodospirillales bacterium]